MSPVPGQRAAQTNRRAAVTASRAIGRAIGPGGLTAAIGMEVHGRRFEMRIGAAGTEEWTDTTTGRAYSSIPPAEQLDDEGGA